MFQKSQQLSCIDLIFTNKPNLFQHSTVFETGLSYFPLLTVTKFKKHKTFDNEKFRSNISIKTILVVTKTPLPIFLTKMFH